MTHCLAECLRADGSHHLLPHYNYRPNPFSFIVTLSENRHAFLPRFPGAASQPASGKSSVDSASAGVHNDNLCDDSRGDGLSLISHVLLPAVSAGNVSLDPMTWERVLFLFVLVN